MNTLFKIICAAAFTFTLCSCRKEIHEPPANTRNQNFVYVEIDGEKFMVEDRSWNLNRNTKGTFRVDDSSINVRFLRDTIIEIWFNARNTAVQNKRGFRYLSMGLNMEIIKKTGLSSVKQINLSSICYTENDKVYYSYSIYKNLSSTYSENNSFKNCSFTVVNYDEVNRTVEFKITGKVENERENNKLVSILIYVKLKNNSKF